MPITYSLDDLKHYHNEAMIFFAAELSMLKEVITKIKDDKLGKAATLLFSCQNTGAAILELLGQADMVFSNQSAILARSFMETITNFCYLGICDEKEYRAFLLHPIYKRYHNITMPKIEDDSDLIKENFEARKELQKKLKEKPIVQEALAIFSETKSYKNWTTKSLDQKIDAIQKWGKLMDVFFTINKITYYSDASELIHGSLYGCTYRIGGFDPEFDHTNLEEIDKKVCKDSTCMLLPPTGADMRR